MWICRAKKEHIEIIKLLLELTRDVRINKDTDNKGFIDVCIHKHLKIIKLLLELKEDQKVSLDVINTTNNYSILYKSKNIIDLLEAHFNEELIKF